MEANSEIAANRTIITTINGKKQVVNVRYLKCRLFEAYSSFPFKNGLSFSSFVKYTGKEFKKPHRQSDKCDYCEEAKDIKRIIEKELLKHDYSNTEYDSDHLLLFAHEEKKNLNEEIMSSDDFVQKKT